jgi:hypothetical protein
MHPKLGLFHYDRFDGFKLPPADYYFRDVVKTSLSQNFSSQNFSFFASLLELEVAERKNLHKKENFCDREVLTTFPISDLSTNTFTSTLKLANCVSTATW